MLKINPARKLSHKENETLLSLILHPKHTNKEHADMLGISALTLGSRRERIAKKFGAATFAGVLALIICESFNM